MMNTDYKNMAAVWAAHQSLRNDRMKLWVLFTVIFALTACSSTGRINHAGYGRYSASTAYTAAKGGEMPLAIYGSPAPGDQVKLAENIAQGLNGTHVEHSTKFVPTASPDLEGYRTVVVFGPTTPEDVCKVAGPSGMSKNSPTSVTSAFCLGPEVLSYTAGSLSAIEGVGDPALASYMRQIGYTLFPPENPNYETRSRKPFSW
jgi:hypothetical protein